MEFLPSIVCGVGTFLSIREYRKAIQERDNKKNDFHASLRSLTTSPISSFPMERNFLLEVENTAFGGDQVVEILDEVRASLPISYFRQLQDREKGYLKLDIHTETKTFPKKMYMHLFQERNHRLQLRDISSNLSNLEQRYVIADDIYAALLLGIIAGGTAATLCFGVDPSSFSEFVKTLKD